MKICLLNDSFPPLIDGVSSVVLNYAEELTRNGDEVVVATPKYPHVDYSHYPFKVLAYQSFNTSSLTYGYRTGNVFTPEILELKKFNPDIIHAHAPFSSLILGYGLSLLTKAPLVFTYHTKYDIDIARAVKFKVIQNTVIRHMINVIYFADEVWTVSQGAGENLKQLGYKKDYLVMNNGIDFVKGLASEQMIKDVTANYDLPKDVPLYLFVGRMFEYKGISLIIDALKILKAKNFDYRMVFIGDGPDREKIINYVDEYGLKDKVFVIGKISDREILRAWYSRSDLFIFPSTYDTNGIVVNEAAACETASILIKGSCAAENTTDFKDAFLIEENSESLADMLLKIGHDFDLMKSCGIKAMNDIYLSKEDAVKMARKRYEYLINNKKNK